MKVADLLKEALGPDGRTKGSWKITDFSGHEKTFKDEQSPEALAWMKHRGSKSDVWDKASGKWIEDPKKAEREEKKLDREDRKAEREEARAAKGPKFDLKAVYNEVMDVISNSFPDGDPITPMAAWFRKTYGPNADSGCSDIIDQAMRKYGSGIEKKGMHEYLADMWEETAADRMYDATEDVKSGGKPDDSEYTPFVDFDKDGLPSLADNPWLTVDEQKKRRAKREKEYKVMHAQMMTALKKAENK